VSNTLIVGYCWIEDVEHMGALINHHGAGQPELIDLTFNGTSDPQWAELY